MSEPTPSLLPCTIVGASFAGLACAMRLAEAGIPVEIVERKSDPGEKLHTTGILVRDVMDRIAWLNEIPPEMLRRIDGVRLYAPNMRWVDLNAPGYYFLATDMPQVLRWMAQRCVEKGARIRYDATFAAAEPIAQGFDLGDLGECAYLVGADGPKSQVAKALGLGQNRQFLFGIEHEYESATLDAPDRLHCFIDRRLAPGYIGWVIAGVGIVQVGLARRVRDSGASAKDAMAAFLDKIAPVFDFRDRTPSHVRAGFIPCGGLVRPLAAERALLVGDAAGMVSPLTAGGIHTALEHGRAAGDAIAAFRKGTRPDPQEWFVSSYPRFRLKRMLRWSFDHFQSDLAFNLLLGAAPVRAAARVVFFQRKRKGLPL
jgi:digeranylgeranylglycerophospholipid reductase